MTDTTLGTTGRRLVPRLAATRNGYGAAVTQTVARVTGHPPIRFADYTATTVLQTLASRATSILARREPDSRQPSRRDGSPSEKGETP
jgi:hypothetical protein